MTNVRTIYRYKRPPRKRKPKAVAYEGPCLHPGTALRIIK